MYTQHTRLPTFTCNTHKMQFRFTVHTHTHTRMSGCQWCLWLASRTGRGSPREGRALWPQPASPEMPSLHFPAAPLTLPLVLFLPGSQVQCREPTALDKVLRESVGHEDVVLGHDGDACVVTDDAGQGDPGQGLLLLLAEHTTVLPPEPAWEHPRPLCLRPSWGLGGHPLAGAVAG